MFSLESMPTIFPTLRKGGWEVKLDLTDAYFHLGLGKYFRRISEFRLVQTCGSFKGRVLAKAPSQNYLCHPCKIAKKMEIRRLQVFVYLDGPQLHPLE